MFLFFKLFHNSPASPNSSRRAQIREIEMIRTKTKTVLTAVFVFVIILLSLFSPDNKSENFLSISYIADIHRIIASCILLYRLAPC